MSRIAPARWIAAAVMAGILSLTIASSASAAGRTVFCVHRAHCHGIQKDTVQAAAKAAVANGRSRDLILVGAGHFSGEVSDAVSSDDLAERRPFDLAGLGSRTVLKTGGNGVSLMRSNISAVAINGPLQLAAGVADRVRIRGSVQLEGGYYGANTALVTAAATFRRGIVEGGSVRVVNNAATVEDSVVKGLIYSDGSSRQYEAGEATVRRVRMFGPKAGVKNVASISDSVIHRSGGGEAITASCLGGSIDTPANVNATNVTVIGDGSPGSTGAASHTEPGGYGNCYATRLTLRSSIVRGFAVSLREDRGRAPDCTEPDVYQDCPFGRHEDNVLAASYSDYDPSRVRNDRPVSVDFGHNVNLDPRFVNAAAGDFRLRYDSKLLGAGAPNRPANLGHFDAAGHRRVVDADHDGAALIDIGAHEYQGTGPHAVLRANPHRPYPYQDVTFDARRSTDPDSAHLTYRWYFGDGDTATGARVAHSYDASHGIRRVTLLVTDYQGYTSIAHRDIRIRRPPILCGHRC